MRDRRQSPRQSYWLPGLSVAIQQPSQAPKQVTLNARDISARGIALEHNQSLPAGTTVYLNLPTLDSDWLPIEGHVVSCRPAANGFTIAVAFAWPVDLRRVQLVAA